MTLVGSLIEHCIQPRCLLSPMDADFCAQFIKVMHTQGTPGFHTLMCYDKVRVGAHPSRRLSMLRSSFSEIMSKLFYSPVASTKREIMV